MTASSVISHSFQIPATSTAFITPPVAAATAAAAATAEKSVRPRVASSTPMVSQTAEGGYTMLRHLPGQSLNSETCPGFYDPSWI